MVFRILNEVCRFHSSCGDIALQLHGNTPKTRHFDWLAVLSSIACTFGMASGTQIPASDKYPDRSASSKVMFFTLPLVLWYFIVFNLINGNCVVLQRKHYIINMCQDRSVWSHRVFLQVYLYLRMSYRIYLRSEKKKTQKNKVKCIN